MNIGNYKCIFSYSSTLVITNLRLVISFLVKRICLFVFCLIFITTYNIYFHFDTCKFLVRVLSLCINKQLQWYDYKEHNYLISLGHQKQVLWVYVSISMGKWQREMYLKVITFSITFILFGNLIEFFNV
jgi:hypothetical protein